MASINIDIDWDQLSVGSNESFFQRRHPDHEPLQEVLLKSAIEKWTKDVAKTNERRQSRKAAKENRPVAAVHPRGRSAPPKKAPSTIPVTPNVLKKRTMPRLTQFKPEPIEFKFKAKPAPQIHKQHKSCGNLNKIAAKPSTLSAAQDVARAMSKLSVAATSGAAAGRTRTVSANDKENQPSTSKAPIVPKVPATAMAPTRSSRPVARPTVPSTEMAPKRVRSNSAPNKARATIPVTPMVLKRNNSRNRQTIPAAGTGEKEKDHHQFQFKAKPAEVLLRKPFKPKLAANKNAPAATVSSVPAATKPLDRKCFNYRSTDAFEKKQKRIEEEKKRAADQEYQAARKLTNFRATRNPFKCAPE